MNLPAPKVLCSLVDDTNGAVLRPFPPCWRIRRNRNPSNTCGWSWRSALHISEESTQTIDPRGNLVPSGNVVSRTTFRSIPTTPNSQQRSSTQTCERLAYRRFEPLRFFHDAIYEFHLGERSHGPPTLFDSSPHLLSHGPDEIRMKTHI